MVGVTRTSNTEFNTTKNIMNYSQNKFDDLGPPETFKLKDGIDPATVDWKKEIELMKIVNDGMNILQQKLDNIIEQRNNQSYQNNGWKDSPIHTFDDPANPVVGFHNSKNLGSGFLFLHSITNAISFGDSSANTFVACSFDK